jgi:regulation of enolase protein 1 (concanavalin A-like superfamily)
MPSQARFFSFAIGILVSCFPSSSAGAQSVSGSHARPLVTQNIDEGKLVELHGNTHPEANAENDRGAVGDDLLLEHMLLQLRRPAEQEEELQEFLEDLQEEGSRNFHHWISAHEFGERFGPSDRDLDRVTDWLEAHHFKVNVVYTSGMVIDFTGTAGQVRKAFHTEIHQLDVKGEKHVANMSNPQIPAALSSLVVGIVSLHDFAPRAMHQMHQARHQFTFPNPLGGTDFALAPADLATIYNLNPLFNAGNSGQGQTIALIEDTDVFSLADWNSFRSAFGLSNYKAATITAVHPAPPSGANNCKMPGVIAPNDAEAILDAEWASAAAPSAAIRMVSCADTNTTFGGLIAMQNLVNAKSSPPAIMSISYGQCEAVNGAAANAAYNSVYKQAVARGVSVFVAAGDSGAAGCDNSVAAATSGIAVNAFASTPYNVAVGGTDFSDTYSSTNSSYWNSANSPTFGSAISYIPEIPWNDSCAGALVTNFEGFSPTYGSTSLCNDPTIGPLLQTTVAGGGGPSACASGTPSITGVVSGTCKGWPKPSWQSILGNPHDGVRDTPDVSLFAADGLWGHFYVFCWSDTANGGAACTGSPSGWSGAGGTSFASPIMAGVQALINQRVGARQGNPNPTYYKLAAAEYGSTGNSSCNSSNGASVGNACVFYDVTLGDMDVNCTGNHNCFLASGSSGVLSTSNNSFAPAYGTTVGWDFATGIGSINAANLVNNWPGVTPLQGFSLTASPNSLTVLQGTSGSSTISVVPQGGFSGSVSLSASGLPAGVTASFSPASTSTTSTLTLSASSTTTAGIVTVTITGNSGSLTSTATISLTVNSAPDFALSASPNSVSVKQGSGGPSAITVTPLNGFAGSVSLSASGLPSGVTASFSPASTTGTSTLTLVASSTATTGGFTVTVTGSSGTLTHTATISLTVNSAADFALSASPNGVSATQGSSGASTITITPQNGFTGSVSLSASGLPSGVTAVFAPPAITSGTSTLTLAAGSTATTGGFTVTVTGSSGTLTHTATISLTVNAAPDFTLSASPNSMSFLQGLSGASTITVSPLNGFGGSVSLSASGLPSGVTAAFSPASTSTTSTLTLSATSAATAGTVTVTISGTSGSLTHTATINLTVIPAPDFGFAASPNSVSVPQGSSGASTITVTPLNGFAGSVSLSASGLPSGVTAVFAPPAINSGTSTLTLAATSTATTGTFTVTAVGTSGILTHTATLSLTVTAVTSTLPQVWSDGDVGSVSTAGSASYSNGVFTVSSSGQFIYDVADGMHFAYQPLSGDGTIVARVLSAQGSTSPQAGVMIREALTAGSTHAYVTYEPAPGASIYFFDRPTTGAVTSYQTTPISALPYWVKLVRSGSNFSGYASADGTNWVQVGASLTISMAQNVYIGLAVSANNNSVVATATFDSVSIDSAAAPAPVISSISANTGLPGTQVTITGSNFGPTQGGSQVTLNNAPVPINSWIATSISITIPPAATSGVLVVSVAPTMNDSNPVNFRVAAQTLPPSWLDQDVGSVSTAGSASYSNGVFTVSSSGQFIYGVADGMHFAYQPLSGDHTIVARVVSAQGSTSPQAGVMIRESLAANSSHAYATYEPSPGPSIYFFDRPTTGAATAYQGTPVNALPYWVKLVRSGNTFSAYTSADGATWVQVGSAVTISMAQNVYIGLAVSANNNSAVATATFDNVTIQ